MRALSIGRESFPDMPDIRASLLILHQVLGEVHMQVVKQVIVGGSVAFLVKNVVAQTSFEMLLSERVDVIFLLMEDGDIHIFKDASVLTCDSA
jgi:hypothetical protein